MGAPIGVGTTRAYKVPTEAPEADGTFVWTATSTVVVTVTGRSATRFGYTYRAGSVTEFVTGKLTGVISGHDAFDGSLCHRLKVNAMGNMGRSGLAPTSRSALDPVFWDLKTKLLSLRSPPYSAARAVPHLRHLRWFHDHVRSERMHFSGAPVPGAGAIRPDMSRRPGLGLGFKRQDTERFAA